jgi:hypothetical protein
MGMSIKLYRVQDSDSIKNIPDLAEQLILNAKSEVDLYKMYEDLYMVLSNSCEPEDLPESIEYKLIFGNIIQIDGNDNNREVSGKKPIGFLTNKEVAEINDWIILRQLNSEEGFYSFFDNLDEEVKETIQDYGSEMEELYEGYFKKLSELYELAVKNNNAIVVCVE